MEERGVAVDHSVINRWSVRVLPILEKVFSHTSVRLVQVDVWMLAYIKFKGVWKYLYRAVDKEGKTIDFRLKAKRDKAAAMRFLDKAIQANSIPENGVVE
jgi:putative transposase